MKNVVGRASFILGASLVLWALTGCSSPEVASVDVQKGDRGSQVAEDRKVDKDSQVVGDWKDDKDSQNVMTFKADHSVSRGSGITAMTGTWSLDDKTVTVKVATLAGEPAPDFKARIEKEATPYTAEHPETKKDMDALGKMINSGMIIALSDDGKKMTVTATGQTMSKVDTKS